MDFSKAKQDLTHQSWVQSKKQEMESHIAWHGNITGMHCEALLRIQPPLTYLLRAGEEEYHYYLSFVQSPLCFKHQPFVIEFSVQGWFFRNGYTGITPTLDEIVPLIMHCTSKESRPLIFQRLGSRSLFSN